MKDIVPRHKYAVQLTMTSVRPSRSWQYYLTCVPRRVLGPPSWPVTSYADLGKQDDSWSGIQDCFRRVADFAGLIVVSTSSWQHMNGDDKCSGEGKLGVSWRANAASARTCNSPPAWGLTCALDSKGINRSKMDVIGLLKSNHRQPTPVQTAPELASWRTRHCGLMAQARRSVFERVKPPNRERESFFSSRYAGDIPFTSKSGQGLTRHQTKTVAVRPNERKIQAGFISIPLPYPAVLGCTFLWRPTLWSELWPVGS
jgi:hypothetical protein